MVNMKRRANNSSQQVFKRPRVDYSKRFPPRRTLTNPVKSRRAVVEKKNKDTFFTLQPTAAAPIFTNPGATSLLNGIPVGTGPSERLGRKLTMRSLYLRYSVSLAATSTGGSPIRILVVYDKQANGAAFAPTDNLDANDFNSPNNLGNAERFITLMDILTPVVSVQNDFSVCGTAFKKIGLDEMFNDTGGGTITDILSGSLYALVAQTSSIGVASPLVNLFFRLRYTDQ